MLSNHLDCYFNFQDKTVAVVMAKGATCYHKFISPDDAIIFADRLKRNAMKIKEFENKDIVKAINTIKNYCYEHNCESCFLGRDEFGDRVCKLGKITPEYWRLDE